MVAAWDRCNSCVKGLIVFGGSQVPWYVNTHARIPKDVFSTLKARYGQDNGPHIYQLCKDIQLFKQGSMTVTDNSSKMQASCDEL